MMMGDLLDMGNGVGKTYPVPSMRKWVVGRPWGGLGMSYCWWLSVGVAVSIIFFSFSCEVADVSGVSYDFLEGCFSMSPNDGLS